MCFQKKHLYFFCFSSHLLLEEQILSFKSRPKFKKVPHPTKLFFEKRQGVFIRTGASIRINMVIQMSYMSLHNESALSVLISRQR